MIAPVLVAPPAEFLPLGTIKDHLRVQGPDEDYLIGELAKSAMQYLDGWGGILGRCILPQTWRITVADLGDTVLPFPDVQSAVVKYLDAAEVEQTLSATAYRVGSDDQGGYLLFDPDVTLPAVADREDAVRIEAVFGYPSNAVPAGIRVAALMLIAHWYQNREGQGSPPAVDALIAPFRRVGV
jgi:uncharacterized phiE125 gp8 family phage protein